MELDEFERIVEGSLRELPAQFRSILEREEISVLARESVPGPLARRYPGSTVYGVFIGVPYGQPAGVQTEPTRIELFMKSFLRDFEPGNEMREQIRRTVMHEVGHYFGFSEKRLRKLGY